MTTYIGSVTRPASGTRPRARSIRKAGLALAGIGVGIGTLALLGSLYGASLAASEGAPDQMATSAILAFGLATAGLAAAKTGIALILLGIVRRLWVRVEAVRAALPTLIQPGAVSHEQLGDYESSEGPATATREAPAPLPIHRMAQLLWLPMLAMGGMFVAIGLVADLSAAGDTGVAGAATSSFAWSQGLMFLGEASLLAAISLLLGTILGAIRAGGGEVQQSLGLTVKTLQMPNTAKAFIGLMVAGVMLAIAQFIGYAVVASAGSPADLAASFAWLGPLREFSLGLLLSGIVLALATIARAPSFQFDRITEIISTGR
jgi:hypothetical protein